MKIVSTLAALVLASTAIVNSAEAVQLVPRGAKPVLRICGGKDGGMYDRAANLMDRYLKDVARRGADLVEGVPNERQNKFPEDR